MIPTREKREARGVIFGRFLTRILLFNKEIEDGFPDISRNLYVLYSSQRSQVQTLRVRDKSHCRELRRCYVTVSERPPRFSCANNNGDTSVVFCSLEHRLPSLLAEFVSPSRDFSSSRIILPFGLKMCCSKSSCFCDFRPAAKSTKRCVSSFEEGRGTP